MFNRRSLVAALFLMMTLPGCVVPGLSTASNPAPLPDDGVRLETMVAETVSAALAQTGQAAPSPLPVVETAETAPPTVAGENPANSRSSLAAQSDGTILFVDELAGYQLNVPPGWLPVRINEQEYYDAFSLPAASEQAVQDALIEIKGFDPAEFRLFIYDLQDGHMENGVITHVNLVWDSQGGISLDDETGLRETIDGLLNSTPELNVVSYSIDSTANEIPIGMILSELPGKTFDGIDVVLFQKQVYLNLPVGTLVLTFTTENNFKDATLSFFDSMVDTLKINPE
jgi:hypothetical protein